MHTHCELPTFDTSTGFGLAMVKREGCMYVFSDMCLPPLPPKFICSSVEYKGQLLTRKEYAVLLILRQPFA